MIKLNDKIKIDKLAIINKLVQKNIKGGNGRNCPPPIGGGALGCPPPLGSSL